MKGFRNSLFRSLCLLNFNLLWPYVIEFFIWLAAKHMILINVYFYTAKNLGRLAGRTGTNTTKKLYRKGLIIWLTKLQDHHLGLKLFFFFSCRKVLYNFTT